MNGEEVELGIGTSSVSGKTHQCAINKIQRHQITTVYKKEMRCITTFVESVTDLRKHLSSSLGGSATINNVAPAVNAAISASSKTSKHDLFCIIKINYVDYVEMIDGTLTTEIDARDLMQSDPQKFYKIYGDSFVKSITYGKEFLAVVHIKADAKEAHVSAKGNVKASNPLFSVNAKTDGGIDSLAECNIAKIDIFTRGMKTSVSKVLHDITELKACIESFEKDSTDNSRSNETKTSSTTSNPENEAVAIESISHPYSEVFNNSNASKLENLVYKTKNILATITQCFDRITLCLMQLRFEENNHSAIKYGNKYSEEANNIRTKLREYQSALQEQAHYIQHKIFFTRHELKSLPHELDKIDNYLSFCEQRIQELSGRTLIASVKSHQKILKGHKHRSSKYFKLNKHMPDGTTHLFFEVVRTDKNVRPEDTGFDLKRRRPIKGKEIYVDVKTETPKDYVKKSRKAEYYIANPSAGSHFRVNIYASNNVPKLPHTDMFSNRCRISTSHSLLDSSSEDSKERSTSEIQKFDLKEKSRKNISDPCDAEISDIREEGEHSTFATPRL